MKKVYLIEFTRINNYNLEDPYTHKITAYSTYNKAMRAINNLMVEELDWQTEFVRNLDRKTRPKEAEIKTPIPSGVLVVKSGKINAVAKIIETEIITEVKDYERHSEKD